MLDQLEKAFPAIIKEVIPKVVTVLKLTDILGRLVEEEISIRDLRGVLQAIAEYGQVEADNVMLTEHVRSALKRYVSHKYARGTNTLVVYLLDSQIGYGVEEGQFPMFAPRSSPKGGGPAWADAGIAVPWTICSGK